jgi:hypothetical protein
LRALLPLPILSVDQFTRFSRADAALPARGPVLFVLLHIPFLRLNHFQKISTFLLFSGLNALSLIIALVLCVRIRASRATFRIPEALHAGLSPALGCRPSAAAGTSIDFS